MRGFFVKQGDVYKTTIRHIKLVKEFFREHPEGRIPTGIWSDQYWNKREWYRWFHRSLQAKISDDKRPWRKLSDLYQSDQRRDARIINDYAKRIRWPGRNLLSTGELRRRYPHINNQEVT
jgi:hypothetical protein